MLPPVKGAVGCKDIGSRIRVELGAKTTLLMLRVWRGLDASEPAIACTNSRQPISSAGRHVDLLASTPYRHSWVLQESHEAHASLGNEPQSRDVTCRMLTCRMLTCSRQMIWQQILP
jgi:hypothetical protein